MKKFNTISGEELLSKEIREIPFIVKDLIPIGLTLLAGSAKVGKSWLALWLSIAVAKGEVVWGYESTRCTTLYLCYEDNEIRIQNRLLEITDEAPSNVHFCTEVSKLGGELETRIRNFISEHQDTKLIIIDTLQTIRSPNTESTYSNDYSDLTILKNLADDYKIAILLIHHFRKQKDGDVFNQITGSTGLQGAVDIAASCKGQTAIIKAVERKEKSEKAPALYDLTTLQRDANRLFGYTAQQTLDYLQALYEKKLCTYPRTDARFLTDDMASVVPSLVAVAAAVCGMDAPGHISAGQVCDSKKVSDHHAIVPTQIAGKADISVLPAGEREIMGLIARQLMCAVSDAHKYAETVVTIECGGYSFTTKGKTVLNPGWKAYVQAEQTDKALPDMSEGNTMFTLSQSKRGEKTATLSCVGRDIESRELELERSEDNIWIKASDSLSESNLKDLSFIKAIEIFMCDKDIYIGNATELSTLLNQISDDTFSNKSISKNIKRLSKSLEKLGILGSARRSNGKRIVELVKAGDDSADQKRVS